MQFLKRYKWILLIFALALGIRIINLQRFPLGFHEDEIKVGWNAYSILKTGKDDLGNQFTLYYNSFGDYRPTGIFYVTIPSLLVFGLNQFAVRFPSAFFGALTVFPMYFMTLLLQKAQDKRKAEFAASFAALLLALSPWHVFTSRATSEAVICLFFAAAGMAYSISGLKSDKQQQLVIGFVLLLLSAFFYHMVRPLLPLFAGTILFYFWQESSPQMRKLGFILFVITALFSVILLSSKASRGRFEQVAVNKYQDNVLGVHTSTFELPVQIKNEYVKYFGLDFLTGDSPKPYRYRVFGVGLLSVGAVLLFIVGLASIAQRKTRLIPLFLLLLSPIPAAVTGEDAPNLHRALFMLPFIAIIAGFGAQYLLRSGFFKQISLVLLTLLFLGSSTSSFLMYMTTGAMDAAPYRNYGAKIVAVDIIGFEKEYPHIVVSDDPDSLYPWYAFLSAKSPKEFNEQAIQRLQGDWTYQNITFTKNKCPSSEFLNNKKFVGKMIVIDSPFCDTLGTQKAHPQVKLELLPQRAPKESQYHFWEREG